MHPIQQASQHPVTPYHPQHPVGGSIIDADGREIPITEQMIQQACRELEQRWQAARQAS